MRLFDTKLNPMPSDDQGKCFCGEMATVIKDGVPVCNKHND